LFEIEFDFGWDCFFKKFDKNIRERIWKKIQSLKSAECARHLKHGIPFFVLEAGQFRVCFEERGLSRTVMFAGTHKQYEKWIREH